MNKLYISIIIAFSILLFSLTLVLFTCSFRKQEEKTEQNIENIERDKSEKTEKISEEQKERELIKNEDLPSLYYKMHQVKEGEQILQLAISFGVSQDSIMSLNKIKNARLLQIGQLLKIPSIDGILYTVKEQDTLISIAKKHSISLLDLTNVNGIKDDALTTGRVLFLPGAHLDWMTIQEINGDLFVCPLRGRYRITSRFGWRVDPFTRNRSFHNGVDMAIVRGTPVYASLAGQVVSTGYSTVYGNHVIIKHHSGYQTLYGHLNSIYTAPNKYVSSNTQIGTVGSTGRSTGPHLHFTVYKNGATIDPMTLLK